MKPNLKTLALHLLPAALAAGHASAQVEINRLIGRAVLDAQTYSVGPTSGQRLGAAPINGIRAPFVGRQPVQGFSAVLDEHDGSFLVMSDNGFGSLENSADYHLRVYRIRPEWKTAAGGNGTIAVEGFIELSDPGMHIPFAITYAATAQRVLTGADFDIESMQRAPDGTLWFGDEFGPFLLHTDAAGRLLQPPIALPDFDNPGTDVRSPQSPLQEEAAAVRIMNALRVHALLNGTTKAPVFSPWFVMLADGNPATFVENRQTPPAGSGLTRASSEVFDSRSLQAAGYPVVCWTVNDKAQMTDLLKLGVDGIISDRPDLLYQAVAEFDANNDGKSGDYLDARGLVDTSRFDAQGHRGGRNLRPENTLPALEVALDWLMSTLELDCAVTKDLVPVLNHDPVVNSTKARRADARPYGPGDEVLVKDLTFVEVQTTFIADKLFRGPEQQNDLVLSPVAVVYATVFGMPHPYAMPSLEQVFQFVWLYEFWYRFGPGVSHPLALPRANNAARVRYNIETKLNPRAQFAARTLPPEPFTRAVAGAIMRYGMQDRADVQSFDFRTLLIVHAQFPQIRTVCLFGDFPIYDDPRIPGSDDGTNLQPERGQSNTPWLAGLAWPYRTTAATAPFRSARSGGFEGMALSHDGTKLLPLLERPLAGGDPRTLLIHEFDLVARAYTGVRYLYPLHPRGEAIGDFVMFSADRGLVIERDNTQGRLDGFKAIYEIQLQGAGKPVTKTLAVDLLKIRDPNRISEPGRPGDVGIGRDFAFPFVTIEDVVVFDRRTIGVINDNNFPMSVGRHLGTGAPDDNEFIVIRLDRPLGNN